MEEPVIHSSAWTGPWDSGRRTVTADATWAKAREELYRLPPEVRKFLQMTWLVLIGTEATLWLISLVTRSAIQEQTISNSPDWLIGAGAFAAVATIGQLGAKTARFLWLRKAILFVAAVGGIGAAIWYSTTMLVARRYAVASAPERTFEYYVCRGRNCSGGYFLHQRRDGSTVEGEAVGALPPFHNTCAEVQRLDGDRGFSWVRVNDRSPPAREIQWPIRAEDCFSNKPLASLKG